VTETEAAELVRLRAVIGAVEGLRELSEAAAQGPWTVSETGAAEGYLAVVAPALGHGEDGYLTDDGVPEASARFIAAAGNAVRAALRVSAAVPGEGAPECIDPTCSWSPEPHRHPAPDVLPCCGQPLTVATPEGHACAVPGTEREDGPTDAATLLAILHEPPVTETVHACPPDGSGLMPCCGRTPFEVPKERITIYPRLVTCAAPSPAVPAVPDDTDGQPT
jgi:hypothetical protein